MAMKRNTGQREPLSTASKIVYGVIAGLLVLAFVISQADKGPSSSTLMASAQKDPCWRIIVLTSSLTVDGFVPIECDVSYLKVTLNGKYSATWFGAHWPDPTDTALSPKLLTDFSTSKGERFNPFATKVVKCEYHVNSLPTRGCLTP